MMTSRPSFYYIASLGIHLLVLLAGLSFQFAKTTPLLGDAEHETIQSYLYEGDRSQPMSANQPRDKSLAEKVRQPLTGVFKQTKKNNSDKNPSTPRSMSSQGHSRGESADALLTLLHTAIQREQQYPPAAMEMERQGRVTVSFTLLPGGVIQGLAILKSSGTESLDQAALAAVSKAAPFKGVSDYLTTPRLYNIDVVFELG